MSGRGKGGFSAGPGTGDAHVGHPDQYFPKGPSKSGGSGGSYTKGMPSGGGTAAPSTSKRPRVRPGSGGSYTKGMPSGSPKSGTPGKKYKPASPKSGTPGKKYTGPSVKSGTPGKKGKPQDFFYGSTGSPPKAAPTKKAAPKKKRYPGDKQHELKVHST